MRFRSGSPNNGTDALVPVVARALGAWERLGLEIGELAVVCGDGLFAETLAVTARFWTPSCYRLSIVAGGACNGAFGATLNFNEPDDIGVLRRAFECSNGAAVTDLTGSAMVWDTVLEAIPAWGRILALGPPSPELTIDFYNNVHRKAVTISGQPMADLAAFDTGFTAVEDDLVKRATTLVTGPSTHRFDFLRSIPNLADSES